MTVYADDNYPPYSYLEDGDAAGIYTEILRILFDRMEGYKVDIMPVPWKYGLHMLKTGKGFALYPPYRHLAKRPYIKPYSLPVLEEKVTVFCIESILKKPRKKWPENYFGLTIANNEGFNIGGMAFNQALKSGHIKMREYPSTKMGLSGVINGEADCYMNDRLSVLLELKKLKLAGQYDMEAFPEIKEGATISVEHGYLGFTARDKGWFPFKYDFLKVFNKELVSMRKSGELEQIVDKYFN